MGYLELSKATGLAISTLQNLACGNNKTRTGRAKVEAALGVQLWPHQPTGKPGDSTAMQGTGTSIARPISKR